MGVGGQVSAGLAVGGACAISGQIILLRELLVVFQGNELSLGVILAGWLLWGAIGSWSIGKRADRFRHPVLVFAVLLALASVLLPGTVFGSACIKRAIGASPVETLGFFEFLPAVIVLLGPLCFVLGGLLAVGAKILDQLAPTRNEVSRAYLLESAGAGVGGLVISFLVVPKMEPIALSFALGATLLIPSFLLISLFPSARTRVGVRVGLLILVLGFAFGAVRPEPDGFRRRIQWHRMDLLEARNSLLGNLAAIEIGGQISLYENGLLVATSGYRKHAEEMAHLGMVQHSNPKVVLLIGGGLGGTLREVLKYPVERCDYVELDPVLLEIGRRHLSSQDLDPLDDPRAAVKHMDGRYFVMNAPREYDVVILDLPGPRSAQLNRFYSLEFFQCIDRILREDGVVVFEVASSEVNPAPEQRLLLSSLRKTVRSVFAQVATLPGDTCYFVLTTGRVPLTDAETILRVLDAAGIDREYIREGMLPFRLTRWRAAQLEEALAEKEGDAKINRDFRPVGYLYDLAQWSAQFRGPLRQVLRRVIAVDGWWAYVGLAVLFFVLGLGRMAARRQAPKTVQADRTMAVGAAVGATGISEIIFQVTVLIGFQVIYGYLFYRLGIMVAAFMVGLAIGSFCIWRRGGLSASQSWRWFIRIHAAVVIYPILLPVLFWYPPRSEIFMFLPAVAGVMGGVEFPLAVQLWKQSGRSVGSAVGALYGLDLFGACVGALIVVPFLIPILGLIGVCWWTAALNVGILALLITPPVCFSGWKRR